MKIDHLMWMNFQLEHLRSRTEKRKNRKKAPTNGGIKEAVRFEEGNKSARISTT